MGFDIRDYIDTKNRTSGNIHLPCPSCQSSDTKNPALSVNLNTGAYHCFKCLGEKTGDIRQALGESKDRIIPTANLATSSQITVRPQQIKADHDKLMQHSRLAKQWLKGRGITEEIIAHYQLGIRRVKRLDKLWWAIAIPIPANAEKTSYYQKLRIQPWDDVPGLPKWSQKGIPAQVWFTHRSPTSTQTFLCEGEWDAMLLGWQALQYESTIAVATFTCGCDTVPQADELARLVGKVTIFYDLGDRVNEKTGERPGEKGALKVATALGSRGWIGTVPQRPEHSHVEGWDVSDAINAGFTLNDFVAATAAAVQPDVNLSRTTSLSNRAMSNQELIAKARDYVDWLVPEMLPSDELFVLAAGPRTGKSLLAMLLAKAVASGDKFLGRVCTRGNVLYINLEDSDTKIKIRQQAQGWDADLPVWWLNRFKLSQTDQLYQLAQELDIRLIILDTFSRIRDDSSLETSAEVARYLEPLQNMANELKLSILLVHHTTKISIENANNLDVFDTIRGSGAIRAVARGSWVFAASERTYRLCVEHGFGERQDLEVLLDPETLTWRSVRPWNPKSGTQVDLILEYLKTAKSATIPEIATSLNLNPNCVTTALWRLQQDNTIWKEPGKKYHPAIYHLNPARLPNMLGNCYGTETPSPHGLEADNPLPNKECDSERYHSQQEDHFLNKSSDTLIPFSPPCISVRESIIMPESVADTESQFPNNNLTNGTLLGNQVSESPQNDTFCDDTFLSENDTSSSENDTPPKSVITVQQECNTQQDRDEIPRKFEVGDLAEVDFPGSKRHGKTAQIKRLKTIQNCEIADVLVEGEKRVWEVQIAWLKPQAGEQKNLFAE